MRMQDREVVAAIVAGDPDGIAEAYDKYAMPLYSYCRSLLREPADAADAVQDTFLIATSKLSGLRDPGKLRSWLYAVARNECYRKLRSGEATSALDEAVETVLMRKRVSRPIEQCEVCGELKRRELSPALFAGALPLVALTPGFREQVLKMCADFSSAGLARRASVAARAGQFGPAGFPKPGIPPGASGWHQVIRHSHALVASAATAAVAAGVSAVLIIGGGATQAHAPAAGARGSAGPGVNANSRGAPARGSGSSPGAGSSGAAPSASPGAATVPAALATGPGSHAAPGTSGSATSASGSSPSGAASSSSSPTPVVQGTLAVSLSRLVLVAVNGHGVGTFTLTAKGGPVSYSISAAAGLTVSHASGSLSSGASATITVTSSSLIALNERLTVNPGGYTVTIVLNISL